MTKLQYEPHCIHREIILELTFNVIVSFLFRCIVEQARSEGTVEARYFLIPVWQHKGNRIHHPVRYLHSMILRTVHVLVLEDAASTRKLCDC